MAHVDSLLTTREVAAQLAVTPATVRRWARAGIVPAHRVAGPRAPYRFDVRELDAVVRAETEREERT